MTPRRLSQRASKQSRGLISRDVSEKKIINKLDGLQWILGLTQSQYRHEERVLLE